MFCSYCGKRIADDARFCSFCGKGVVGVTPVQPKTEQPYAPAPEAAAPIAEYFAAEAPELVNADEERANALEKPIDAADVLSSEQQLSLDISTQLPSVEPVGAENDPVSESVSEQQILTARQIFASEQQEPLAAPQAQAPEQQGYAANFAQTPERQIPQQPAFIYPQTQAPERQNNAPERKYTAAHLIMCLASTAVFAIAAGVFAGLYFAGL